MSKIDYDQMIKGIKENLQIDDKYLFKIVKNNGYNNIIKEYYQKLFEKHLIEDGLLSNKIQSLEQCNSIWELDKYEEHKIKDFQKTNLCKDKFCNNCKKVKQASRMSRFIPYLEQYKENLYHLVLTQPNIVENDMFGVSIKNNIALIYKSFWYLVRYLKGNKKISGIDFSEYNYLGAVRSLEVTFTGNEYHPHLHVAIALNGKIGTKKHINKYSHSYKSEKVTKFSDLEILIQKIWYLLMNNKTVNKENIQSLEVGYSCKMDKFKENDYAELFKYMTKASGEDELFISYNNFEDLYFGLHGTRQIQGYGVFYRISDKDIEDEVDNVYIEIQEILQKNESPRRVFEAPQELIKDNGYTIISRKRIYQHLKII